MLCRALGTKYILHFTVPAVHSHRIHSAGLNLRSRSRFHGRARTRAPSICLSVWLLLLLQALLAPAYFISMWGVLLFALALARSCPTSKPLLHQATVALSQFKLSDLLMLYSSGLL